MTVCKMCSHHMEATMRFLMIFHTDVDICAHGLPKEFDFVTGGNRTILPQFFSELVLCRNKNHGNCPDFLLNRKRKKQ